MINRRNISEAFAWGSYAGAGNAILTEKSIGSSVRIESARPYKLILNLGALHEIRDAVGVAVVMESDEIVG